MLKTICLPINLTIQLILGLMVAPRTMLYMRKYGVLYIYLRSALDFRFHDYFHSRIGVIQLVEHFESIANGWVYGTKLPEAEILEVKRLLCTLYCDQLKLHMLRGDLELACLTVIQAHRKLNIDRLPNMPDFDLKTAHVVKAGIAASRLLEEGGLATLMIREGEIAPQVSAPPKPKKPKVIGNIIPFRKKP